jgi:hypothetical protein
MVSDATWFATCHDKVDVGLVGRGVALPEGFNNRIVFLLRSALRVSALLLLGKGKWRTTRGVICSLVGRAFRVEERTPNRVMFVHLYIQSEGRDFVPSFPEFFSRTCHYRGPLVTSPMEAEVSSRLSLSQWVAFINDRSFPKY